MDGHLVDAVRPKKTSSVAAALARPTAGESDLAIAMPRQFARTLQ